MTAPRGLSAEEAAAWEKVAATVEPLDPSRTGERDQPKAGGGAPVDPVKPAMAKPKPSPAPLHPAAAHRGPAPRRAEDRRTLDGSWDRRLKSGTIQPDVTLDLHGHNLDAAYDRLMSGVAQARAMEARTILLVTGKPRPVDPADRGSMRGAIRAKVLDWLAASSHHCAIAAVRRAHIRHGGDGALYIVLRRARG